MAARIPFLLFMLTMAVVAESVSWDIGSQLGLTDIVYAIHNNGDLLDATKKCDGRVGDCIDEEEEMMMDSEIHRRGLYRKRVKFISYGALKKDRTPCSRRGRSYYGCGRSKKVNPYRRGCSVISRCYRFTK